MKLLKFGGKSLANGVGINSIISIITQKVEAKERIVVVVSARGNATNNLEDILEKAKLRQDFHKQWQEFKEEQIQAFSNINFSNEFSLLEKIFQGVGLVEDYSLKIKDLVLAQGEILSAKIVEAILTAKGIKSKFVDSRLLLKTDEQFGNARIIEDLSRENTEKFFLNHPQEYIPIITGFIASTKYGDTTTLGRNGSNYTASLFANYLKAQEVESYTHINGIYTANPEQVYDAQIIKRLNYQEAGELAEFGASILHAKTIIPLIEKNIPLRILNTFAPNESGTLISSQNQEKGVKAISVQEDVCIISIVGKGFLGKKGIDARIFKTLADRDISVGVVSQGSSERGVDFIIKEKDAETAVSSLKQEFEKDFNENDVSSISAIKDIAVITIIGQDLEGFANSYNALSKNGIQIRLINNTLNGKNISLIIDKPKVNKAINVIHGHIFGIAKKINIAIFGKGKVGASLINQILLSKDKIQERREINLNIFAISGSNKLILNHKGIGSDWAKTIENTKPKTNILEEVIAYAQNYHLENLIAIDNTASDKFIYEYSRLISSGFDMISSNKQANTQDYIFYRELRNNLAEHKKQYLYETNVGAGLPLIDTIKLLHNSGENITRIRGVFSGSLSYLFNEFSSKDIAFSELLLNAIKKGYTEPDAREDLCGNDVARKLLILARELDLENEFNEISIENLIPECLRNIDLDSFMSRLSEFNEIYAKRKNCQNNNFVLRYVGDLSGDLHQNKGLLSVKLVSVPIDSALGQLKGADSIFEIYTESYGDNPIVIQGAGAGAEVTARGVFGDLLRISDKL